MGISSLGKLSEETRIEAIIFAVVLGDYGRVIADFCFILFYDNIFATDYWNCILCFSNFSCRLQLFMATYLSYIKGMWSSFNMNFEFSRKFN